MNNICKNVGLRFKLDFWVLILREDETVVDGTTGEIAGKATKAKLYTDRLKCVLTTRCHLDAFVKSLTYISEEDITNVHMPIVQVMGLEAKAFALHLIEKKYVMEGLKTFKFPRTSDQLKPGELESLVHGLTLIEEMVNSLESKFNDEQTESESSVDGILKEKKKTKEVIIKECLNDVTWEPNDEESDHKEESDSESDEESDLKCNEENDVEESKEASDEESKSGSDNQENNEEIASVDSDEDQVILL